MQDKSDYWLKSGGVDIESEDETNSKKKNWYAMKTGILYVLLVIFFTLSPIILITTFLMGYLSGYLYYSRKN